jgi:hypothetical protein
MTNEEWMEFIRQSIPSHDRQIGELTEQVASVTAAVAALVKVTNDDAQAIRSLARIAERHEERLDNLDGGNA